MEGGSSAFIRMQEERKLADDESIMEDISEFTLPRNHKIEENLNRDNLEQSSEDKFISSQNVGFRMLQRMGWKGKGLGKTEQGIEEPIKAGMRDPKLGLGKQEEDDFYTSEQNITRKRLDIEIEDTEESAQKRQIEAERELKLQSEVKEILRPFFCELCSKQYKIAIEYEGHLSSYDHNHKKRFRDMKMRLGSTDDKNDRKKKEELREEKERAKMVSKMEAQKQQKKKEEAPPIPQPVSATPSLPSGQVKFGFGGAKPVAPGKVTFGVSGKAGLQKKKKVVQNVTNVFGDDLEG